MLEEKIKEYAKNSFNITVLDSISSTNTELKKWAKDGAEEGTVLIARTQTQGRGRHGRSFFSPKNSGIYMSLLLRPSKFVYYSYITPAAAVAVCRALKNAGSENLGIKWVNDIFVGNKKVSGILTEIEFKKNSSEADYIIVGIGINVTTEDFPDEIKSIAGSAFEKEANKEKIAADTLDFLFDFYKNLEKLEFLEEYKNLSILKNRDVLLISPAGEQSATVIGIDDNCRLIAKLPDGSISYISTGEVSLEF